MKSKIHKILGVVLTLALVLSMGVVFMAAPVSADPDEWSTYDYPDEGADGDYFYDSLITAGPGPIARDIDGTFWVFANPDTGANDLLKSLDTEGRSWEVTEYQTETTGGAIVAIAPSSIDADVVYVADATNVYKTEDGGDTWTDLGTPAAGVTTITCLDVGYVDDEPHIFVGTADGPGEVYYYHDVAFARTWTDLNVQASTTGVAAGLAQVYGIAVSPDFDSDVLVAALITTDAVDADWADAGVDRTFVVTNEGATAGTWPDIELTDSTGAADPITEGSDPVFVEDFDIDDAYEFFVGVTGAMSATGNGAIYRIYGTASVEMLDDVDDDIISLDLAGNQGDTYLLAGAQGAADVWYSDDDGVSWLQASAEGIQPSGGTNTYVIADADIANNGIGWAATGAVAVGANNVESAVSMTTDGGAVWLGISLIDTDIDSVEGLAMSPDFASPGLMFVLTDDGTSNTDSVFRYDGTNWERVYESTQYIQAIDLIAVSPDINTDNTVFLGDTGSDTILFSEDNGTVFEAVRVNPGDLNTWAIVDADTIIAGGLSPTTGDAAVFITDIQGRRAWDEYEVEAAAVTIASLAVNSDTVLAGNAGNDVFISEDFGETWDQVGAALTAAAAANTYVAFDSDYANTNTIYAASDDVIARFLDTGDLTEDWENFDVDVDGGGVDDFDDAIGILCVDGVLYAASDNAVAALNAGDGAILRSVNPLEDLDDVAASEFDHVTGGLTAAVDNFDSLAYTTGSTILWAYDISTATIWTYEDVLAAPVTGVVADPDVDSAILSWTAFDNATDYDVVVYGNEDMDAAYEWYDAATGTDLGYLIVNANSTTGAAHGGDALDAGTQYWAQVRATAPVNSKWSDVITFTTDPTTMTVDADQFGPAIGAINIPITPAFGWGAIDEADSYVIEVSDTADFSNIVETATVTNPVYQLQTTLNNSTNYFWRVKAVSGTSESNWATGTFTTAAAPVEAPAPPEPAPPVEIVQETITPTFIYAIIGIGAALAILVIVLILKTRRP